MSQTSTKESQSLDADRDSEEEGKEVVEAFQPSLEMGTVCTAGDDGEEQPSLERWELTAAHH